MMPKSRLWATGAALFACLLGQTGSAAAQGEAVPLIYPAVDANGVDVVTGTLVVSSPVVSIGDPGAGGLSYSQVFSGDEWYHSSFAGIFKTEAGSRDYYTVILFGSAQVFREDGSGGFTAQQATGAFLTAGSGGDSHTFTAADGTVVEFEQPPTQYTYANYGKYDDNNGEGIVSSVTSPNGDRTDFHYNTVFVRTYGGAGIARDEYFTRLQSVTTTRGYQIHFDYANNATDATQLSQAQLIDWGTVTTATLLNNAVDYCDPLAYSCTYSQTWPSLTIAEPSTGVRTFTDVIGRVTRITRNTDRLVTGMREPGRTSDNIVFNYDTSDRVNRVTVNTMEWSYSYYDNTGTGTRTTYSTNPDDQDTVIESSLSTGLVTAVEDAYEERTRYTYNAEYRLESVIYPEGNSIEYGYDGRGNVTEVTRVAKPGSGLSDLTATFGFPATCSYPATCNQPTWARDAIGNQTDFTYDNTHGGLLTVREPAPSSGAVRPEQRVVYAQYQAYFKNSGGSIVASGAPVWLPNYSYTCRTTAAPACLSTADGYRTTYTYGSTGVANNLAVTAVNERGNDGALSATTGYAVDAVGNVVEVDPPLQGSNNRTVFFYDAARRQIGEVGPDIDASGALTHSANRTTYNDVDQVTKVEFGTVSGYSAAAWSAFSPLDREEVDYDDRDLVSQVRLMSGSDILALTQYTHDDLGQPICVAQRMNPAAFGSLPASACWLGTEGSFGPDRITRTAFDRLGRVATVRTGYGTPGVAVEVQHAFTANGREQNLYDGEGNRTYFSYDGHDRLRRVDYASPTTAGIVSGTDYETWLYDGYGRMTQRRNRSAQTFTPAYDNMGRVTSMSVSGAATTSYTYDNQGRVLTVTDGIETITNTYNARGWLASQTGANGTVSYDYNDAGQRTQMTWPDSFYVTYGYNHGGMLSSIRENGATSGAGVLALITYNQHGQRASLKRANGAGARTDYAYDAASRLEELTQNLAGTVQDRTLDFAYNPAGQIVSRTDSNTGYAWTDFVNFDETTTYDGLNRILSVTGQSAVPQYDTRGNMTRDHNGQTYAYDDYNRLVTAGSVDLAYDPAGRLREVDDGVSPLEFLYDGLDLIAEYDDTGTLLARYVHGPGMDEPLVQYSGALPTTRQWLMADERGSIVAVTDATGVAVQINAYDEYGVPDASNNGRFGYTGQVWLAQTGLYHYKNRAYNPELGRFMQTDPIGVNGGINLYAYVGADPVNYVDPLGLQQEDRTPPDVVTITGTRVRRCILFCTDPEDDARTRDWRERRERAKQETSVSAMAPLRAYNCGGIPEIGQGYYELTLKQGHGVEAVVISSSRAHPGPLDLPGGAFGAAGVGYAAGGASWALAREFVFDSAIDFLTPDTILSIRMTTVDVYGDRHRITRQLSVNNGERSALALYPGPGATTIGVGDVNPYARSSFSCTAYRRS